MSVVEQVAVDRTASGLGAAHRAAANHTPVEIPAAKPRAHTPARFSLRARITLWVIVVFALIETCTQGVFLLYQRTAIDRVFDDQLTLNAREVAAAISPLLPTVTRAELDATAFREFRFFHFERFVVDIFDGAGRSVVTGTDSTLSWSNLRLSGPPPDAAPVHLRIAVPALRATDPDAPTARIAVVGTSSATGGRYAIVVASSDNYARSQYTLITRLVIISAIIGLFAAAVSARIIAGMAVAPIERLRSMASRLGPESIGQPLVIASQTSEVTRLTDELDRARQRIQESIVAKERFLSNVSHEIKTPIAVMLIESQTVNREGCSASVTRYMQTVEEEMSRLGRLVESFLTLTRTQTGRGPAVMQRYAINDIVADSVEACTMMARQHHVSLHPTLLDNDETIDAAAIGDPDLLRTMIDNLIRNCIRFSPEEGRVEIEARANGEWATIIVRDEGVGISPERLVTLFNRFAEGTDERKARGHGLGLAISQGIAELHGGSISVANRPGIGSEFVVSLHRAGSEPGEGGYRG